ncbi:MAG: M48 family peptidase [Candidatus Electrothrix sp. ATG1]|nr:M48 family peptidase [Candidatus Electrothrix sp. ATG1]
MSFDYKVIRRPRRKTASISVHPDCSVRVLVPSFVTDCQVEELIQRKTKWIKSKLSEFEEIRQKNRPKEYVSGESFSYLGRNYRLKVINSDLEEERAKLIQSRFHVVVPAGLEQEARHQRVINQLSAWYRHQAAVRLQEKTACYAKRLLVSPASVGIKDYRSRWGTCHSDGRIYYNWRIIMAPHSVIDYVVVHELCHLVHLNHSKRFWDLVSTILPDYAEQKAWIKVNGSGLEV